MTLDDLMQQCKGEWRDDCAYIQAQDGYYWKVATKTADGVAFTSDGLRFGLSAAPSEFQVAPDDSPFDAADALAAIDSALVVESSPTRRGKRVAKDVSE
jgi:hypothetical protein